MHHKHDLAHPLTPVDPVDRGIAGALGGADAYPAGQRAAATAQPPARGRRSSRSRSTSPTMFRQYITSVSAIPGYIASRGAISMYWRPSRLNRAGG